jgi:hypothetical protein
LKFQACAISKIKKLTKKKVDSLYTFLERADPKLIKKITFEISLIGTFEMAQA